MKRTPKFKKGILELQNGKKATWYLCLNMFLELLISGQAFFYNFLRLRTGQYFADNLTMISRFETFSESFCYNLLAYW